MMQQVHTCTYAQRTCDTQLQTPQIDLFDLMLICMGKLYIAIDHGYMKSNKYKMQYSIKKVRKCMVLLVLVVVIRQESE